MTPFDSQTKNRSKPIKRKPISPLQIHSLLINFLKYATDILNQWLSTKYYQSSIKHICTIIKEKVILNS